VPLRKWIIRPLPVRRDPRRNPYAMAWEVADIAATVKALRSAWFKDSEGNLLGIGQPVRRGRTLKAVG
jgi:hypothetical protein